MRLYLSSFRLGDHPGHFTGLTGPAARVAVIVNAMDAAPADMRGQAVQRELDAMTGLGLQPAELDLRDYFTRPADLPTRLAGCEAVWVRGGNTFVLRHALHGSGADALLTARLRRDTWSMPATAPGRACWRPACTAWKRSMTPRPSSSPITLPPAGTG